MADLCGGGRHGRGARRGDHARVRPSVWDAFLASAHFTRTVVLESGQTGWHKIQSVFAVVRMWGGPVPLAYAVQAAVTVALAAALIWLWRSRADFALKAAALIIAAILATPYSLDYDLTALAPAIAFLAAHGLRCGFAPSRRPRSRPCGSPRWSPAAWRAPRWCRSACWQWRPCSASCCGAARQDTNFRRHGVRRNIR